MRKMPGFVTRAGAVALSMFLAGPGQAQPAFPSKPIRLIVPYAPGSALDVEYR